MSKTIYMATLRAAVEERQRIDRRIGELMEIVFHPGDRIEWKYGKGTQTGVVLMAGCGTRLKVRNDARGTEYWIRLYNVLDAAK